MLEHINLNFSFKILLIRFIGILLIILAIVIGSLGYLIDIGIINLLFHYQQLIIEYYSSISTELVSLGITILIIDVLYEIRNVETTKRDLILQMGSPNNALAIEATRKLMALGTLTDGSLRNANLINANLKEANLFNANLINAKLMGANLANTDFTQANIHRVDLQDANLQQADLSQSRITMANLKRCN